MIEAQSSESSDCHSIWGELLGVLIGTMFGRGCAVVALLWQVGCSFMEGILFARMLTWVVVKVPTAMHYQLSRFGSCTCTLQERYCTAETQRTLSPFEKGRELRQPHSFENRPASPHTYDSAWNLVSHRSFMNHDAPSR